MTSTFYYAYTAYISFDHYLRRVSISESVHKIVRARILKVFVDVESIFGNILAWNRMPFKNGVNCENDADFNGFENYSPTEYKQGDDRTCFGGNDRKERVLRPNIARHD